MLKHAQVPVIHNSFCKLLYAAAKRPKTLAQLGKNVICAGHAFGGDDACQGDSGGPLMLPIHEIEPVEAFPYYLIGIVSYGIGCGRSNAPGVYTSVPYYADWIQQHL